MQPVHESGSVASGARSVHVARASCRSACATSPLKLMLDTPKAAQPDYDGQNLIMSTCVDHRFAAQGLVGGARCHSLGCPRGIVGSAALQLQDTTRGDCYDKFV